MKFQHPQWLWCLLALVPVAWMVLRDERRRLLRLERFAGRAVWGSLMPELDPRARVRKTAVWLAALALALVALARPQWGTHEETVKTTGLDIMVVLDVSNSMETEDVVPSRLKKARHLIKSLAERLRGDRVGLVAFASSSYVAVPLTTDTDYFLEMLQILGPRTVTNQGTDIGLGLDTARKALERGAEEAGGPTPEGSASQARQQASHAIVLISDGEDQEDAAVQAAKAIKDSGAKLFVLGVGTEKGGPVPVRDESGNLIAYKKDRRGQPVVSSFRPDALLGVAQAGNGRYWNVTVDEGEVDEMLRELGALNRTEYAERRYLVYEDRYQWPLALAVLLLLLELSMPARKLRGGTEEDHGRAGTVARARAAGSGRPALWIGLALGLAALSAPGEARAAPLAKGQPSLRAYLENEKGLKAFKEGRVGEAQQEFGTAQALDPNLPELQFNQGVVQLRQGEVDGAVRAFQEAAKGATERSDAALESKSLYNLGGALAKKGDTNGAVRSYLGAISSAQRNGDRALEQDARKNLELLIRNREKQKQQSKQDQQNQPDQQNSQNQQNQKDQKDQKNQGGKNAQSGPQGDQDKDGKQGQQDRKDQQAKNGDQPKQYEDPSQGRKRKFQSAKLSSEDAERVMAELSNRERELQAKIKKQNGNAQPQGNSKDW